MLYFWETVRNGDSSARVKNYYEANNFLVLMDVRGNNIVAGATVVGDDSGESFVLSNFTIDLYHDLYHDNYFAGRINLDDVLVTDEGAAIAQDDHFTGKPSQDYQVRYIITNDG
jgi:hypothetical protein